MMLRIIMFAIVPLALTPTFAFSQSTRGEKYAFLVVCSKYNNTQLRDLPYTIEEMEDFRKALLKTGFNADHVIMLHDKAERERLPLKQSIEKQFRLLLNGLQANDTVIVAINGHGVHYKGDKVGYYCPLGADLKDKKSLVSMEFFYDLLKKSKAKQKLMIVQACQNDPFVSNDFAAERLEFSEKGDDVPEGIAAIFSCMEGQKSYYDPDRKRGLFFDHVIRSWNGEYLRSGESKLDLESFFQQVRVKTKADALKFRGGVEQVPEVRREYKGEWVLADDFWVQLFNGKDLTGWKTHPDQPGGWAVEDGAIVGRSTRDGNENTDKHLFSELNDLKNFHIRSVIKISDEGNSGVYFRTGFALNRLGRYPPGYEAQIFDAPGEAPRNGFTGSLAYFANVTERLTRPDTWFTLEVIADGDRLTIKLDGKVTADYIDRKQTYQGGHIAIQALPPRVGTTVVHYRKIEIRRLP